MVKYQSPLGLCSRCGSWSQGHPPSPSCYMYRREAHNDSSTNSVLVVNMWLSYRLKSLLGHQRKPLNQHWNIIALFPGSPHAWRQNAKWGLGTRLEMSSSTQKTSYYVKMCCGRNSMDLMQYLTYQTSTICFTFGYMRWWRQLHKV